MSIDTGSNGHGGNGHGGNGGRESAHHLALIGDRLTGTDPGPLPRADFDALGHSLIELARSAPAPPRHIRLQYGQMSVEVDWPETRPGHLAQPAEPGGSGTGAAGTGGVGTAGSPAATGPPPGAPPPPVTGSPAPQPPASRPGAPGGDGTRVLAAPSVGTFFHRPEPGAEPFVAVGDTVRPGQQVGILEVMKMMSPVEAEVAGRVTEFLVADGQPVEFQQPLIAVEPVRDGAS